jgi:hypothetical protein
MSENSTGIAERRNKYNQSAKKTQALLQRKQTQQERQ